MKTLHEVHLRGFLLSFLFPLPYTGFLGEGQTVVVKNMCSPAKPVSAIIPAPCWLCDFRQSMYPFYASVSSSVK